MKISIKNLKGEIFQIDADANEHVSDLKIKIQSARSDLNAERQKLIHSGKVLKDEQLISELGLSESDFIVCMVTKEAAKKPVPAPTPAAAPQPTTVPSTTPTAVTPSTTVETQPAVAVPSSAQVTAPASTATQPYSNETLQALVGLGFPESESRAALLAAMGNPDLAYEFLMTGIPEHARAARATPTTQAAPRSTGIEQLRLHPQFNMLKQLIQQNPAAIPQVLDLIGQQDAALLQTIHENNDAFLAMMSEPIEANPAPVNPAPAQTTAPVGAGNPLGDPTQMFQMLAGMPANQRAQFAQSMGLSAEQLEGVMQMMAQMPPNELQAMLGGMGRGQAGHQHADPPGVIRLTEEEMASVNRLVALGFSQQQAAQAYLACDKNEMLAANLLFEGGWAMEEDDMGHGDFGGHGDDEDDDMYH